MMNGYRKSDSFKVSEKPLNEMGDNMLMTRRWRKGDWSRRIHLSEQEPSAFAVRPGSVRGG